MNLVLKNMEDRVREIKENCAPIVCWGTGEKARGTVPILRSFGIIPVCFCDNNEKKWGKKFEFEGGEEDILSPIRCKELYPDAVYVICTEGSHYVQIAQGLSKSKYYHCNFPFKIEPKFLEIVDERQEKLLESMLEMLEDDQSREIFNLSLNYKLNGDITPLLDKIDGDTMFDDILLKRYKKDETYIDCGAYTGDSMINFLEFCRGRYGKIRLYEGDHNNCVWMEKLINRTRLSNVTVHEQLLWDQKKEMEFYTYAMESDEYVYDNADVSEYRKKNPCSENKDKLEKLSSYRAERRTAERLDELIDADEKVGMIKIVVVGSDMNVLKGCEKILHEKKPAILIEWGACKEDDVWEMIPFIKKCNSDYKFYLRQKRTWTTSKTMLYAI